MLVEHRVDLPKCSGARGIIQRVNVSKHCQKIVSSSWCFLPKVELVGQFLVLSVKRCCGHQKKLWNDQSTITFYKTFWNWSTLDAQTENHFVPLEFCRLSPLSKFSILGLRSREGTMGLRERATWRCGNMYFPCLLRSVLIHILPMHLCLDLTLHTLCFASLSQLDFSVNGYCVFELLNALCLIHSIHSVSIVPEEDSSNSSISHFFLIW